MDKADETITCELIDTETASLIDSDSVRSIEVPKPTEHEKQRNYLRYIFVPFIFLTVALFGGLRLSGVERSFIFLKPALLVSVCLRCWCYFRSVDQA